MGGLGVPICVRLVLPGLWPHWMRLVSSWIGIRVLWTGQRLIDVRRNSHAL